MKADYTSESHRLRIFWLLTTSAVLTLHLNNLGLKLFFQDKLHTIK